MKHHLESKLDLPITIEEAWAFFSDPKNLAVITPPELGFIIRSTLPTQIQSGLKITYTVRPLFGIPMTWVTLISNSNPPHSFSDEQLKGPYKSWHHTHRFESIPGGVRMHDTVDYELPFGIMGELFHKPIVRPKVESIFSFREKVLRQRFGSL